MDEPTRIHRLEPRTSAPVRVVIDSDTYNEIDDQFALVHALLSPEQLTIEAIYAAPFFTTYNNRSTDPGDGMEKSYEEILRILDSMDVPADDFVYKGSTSYLPAESKPAPRSDAVDDLIARARSGDLLYVIAIGAITNIASAIIRAPDIIDNIVVVWLGSHAHWWPHTKEFNHYQDVPAVRVVFGSGVPLVHIPCMGVASHLQTSPAEMSLELKGSSKIGDYLCNLVDTYEHRQPHGWSKVIWDIACVAWLLNEKWAPSQLVHSPIAHDDGTWSYSNDRHLIRQVYWINRDPVYQDLFSKLRARSQV